MNFAQSDALTLGLELEFQIVDQTSGLLAPKSLEIWKALAGHEDLARFTLEATLSTMEVNSSVHRAAQTLSEEACSLTAHVRKAAQAMGLDVRGGGTQMSQFWNERVMAPTVRAKELEKKFGFLPKRFSTYGMHVHVGMSDRDDAIRVGNILQALCPLFIAMSAASPFLQLADTGFAASRPLETMMYPHGGPMPALRDWAHFEEVAKEMFTTELASSLKDIYWDVRPKPEFGTVEIRVFDTPLTVQKAVALAAFSRACSAVALAGDLQFSPTPQPSSAQRVSRFLACRDAMDAVLFNPFSGAWMPARQWAKELFELVQHHPIYSLDAPILDGLLETHGQTQDHETMRAIWSDIQACNPNPQDFSWSLAQYSSQLCKMLL